MYIYMINTYNNYNIMIINKYICCFRPIESSETAYQSKEPLQTIPPPDRVVKSFYCRFIM